MGMHQRYPVGMNLCLTSRCNRRCPNCCVGVGYKSEGKDMEWDEIESLGRLFGHMPGGPIPGYTSTNIGYNMTGGEPSFHERFQEFAPKLRGVLKCDRLIITTNGYGFTRFPESFLAFDEIHTSIYGRHTFVGCPDNSSDIEFMRGFLSKQRTPPQFFATKIYHQARQAAGPGACFIGNDGYVSYWEGLIYPCCTAQGMPGGNGVTPTPDWREKVMQVDLPCTNCPFRGATG